MGFFDRFRKSDPQGVPAETKLVPGVGRLPYPAYRGREPYLFVSYAHADSDLVFQEVRRFNEAGYHVWYDEGIAPGNEWTDEIADALAECSLFVVMITPNSAASRNVQNEINFAIDEGKPFVAIHLRETQLRRGLKLQIGTLQAILKYTMSDEEYVYKFVDAFTRLGLRAHKATETGSAASAAERKTPAEALQEPSPSQLEYSAETSDARSDMPSEASLPPKAPQWGYPTIDDVSREDFEIHEARFGGMSLRKYRGSEVDVAIPQGVEYVSEEAFELSDVERVTIPDSVVRICKDAFRNCHFLEEVVMGDGVKEVQGGAFSGCTGLSSVRLSSRLVELGGEAFSGCEELRSIVIPDYVREIGPRAFEESGLERITLGRRVRVISTDAFFSCASLDHVTLPPSVRELRGSFASCTSLSDITLNEGLVAISRLSFFNCPALRELEIPASVTEIDDEAFDGCDATLLVHAGSFGETFAKEHDLRHRVI